ncbi:MAG: hypothetical protein RIA64_10200 [Rhodospirillales bacterium]
MTACFGKSGSHNRRRWTSGVLVASLWLKALVLAVGLAQPAPAVASDGASAERDLLAALHVICTPGGIKVIEGADGDGTAAPETPPPAFGFLDCTRCCCGPATAASLALGSCLLAPVVFGAFPPEPRSVAGGQISDNPAHPRAPPISIPA